MAAIARLENNGSPTPHSLWPQIPLELQLTKQWALAAPGSDKRPRTISGGMASSTDPSTWSDFSTACAAACEMGWQIGYMLTAQDAFSCIDLDVKNSTTHPEQPSLWTSAEDLNRYERIIASCDSYTERSRSGAGWHIWVEGNVGRGRRRDGVEVYSRERFIICTGNVFLQKPIGPRQPLLDKLTGEMEPSPSPVLLTGDDCPDFAAAQHAAKHTGELGRLWRGEWEGRYPSQSEADLALVKLLLPETSSPLECWRTFGLSKLGERAKASRRDYAASTIALAVQQLATDAEQCRRGAEIAAGLDPAVSSDSCAPPPSSTRTFKLEFAMATDTATLKLEYLDDPWLPRRCVVGFFGRGSTAKSSFLASIAAHVSDRASTLWISVEEPDDWIKVRHIRCGGADKTLAVVRAIESKRDGQGRVVASSFNILTDLEPAIQQAKEEFARESSPALRLVVLDTAVGLTHWGKGESPNDDAAVKKLLAHLQAWAEQHDLTIAVIGHANKGTHDHLADTVMGAAAWTNSPRLSFIHAADNREDYAYVVRVAKSNFDTFGCPYRTEPVHTLYRRDNGPDTVLVRVVPGSMVWGSLNSMEMYREATKKPSRDDDSGDGSTSPPMKVPEQVAHALIERVLQIGFGEVVTREQVELHYGRPVDRARWQKVEQELRGHPLISIERGEKNKAQYRRTG